MYRTVLAALLAVGAAASYAADRIEHASALDTNGYTSIGRLYFNNAGASSYVRFWNSSGQATDFDAKIVGGESGTDYAPGKTYHVTVPDKASLQKSLDDIRTNITGQGGPDITPRAGDTFLTLYVKNDKAGSGVGFQHVTYNGNTGFFENQSICTFDPTQDYSAGNRRLINVHTSQLAAYPSKIEIRNPDAVARAVRGKVYDAATGSSLGSFTVNPAANGSSVLDMSAVEQMIGFRPTSSQLQVNIEFETADASAYTAIVGHTVTQTSTGAVFNLTQACAFNPAHSTTTTTTPSAACTAANPSASSCSNATSAPVAKDDPRVSYSPVPGKTTVIDISVLAYNDSNATGATFDSITPFVDAAGAANGTATMGATTISYTPSRTGTVTFTYKLKNSAGTSNSATVTLTVFESVPVANDDALTGTFKVGQTYTITFATLTANDVLPAIPTGFRYYFGFVYGFFDAGTQTANGTYDPNNQDGIAIRYTPARPGQVTFYYTISTNQLITPESNSATVTLTVVP